MTQWFAEKVLRLPSLASDGGRAVDNLMVYVHWLMLALFIGWIIYFGYVVYRFRASRQSKAIYQGSTSSMPKYVEIAVVVVEAVLLLLLAIPIWARNVEKFPPADESTVIYISAQQFAWNARYAGPDGIFGKQDMKFVASDNVFGVDPSDPNGKDDVQVLNEIHVPVNKPVIVYLSSKDVIHSLKIISMRVTQDAIPGLRIPVWFTPNREGRFQINCAQLCGNGHAAMAGGFLIVESPEKFDKWMKSKVGATTSFE